MTNEDIQSELERHPFRPFRLHLVSGKDFIVNSSNDAHMLADSVLVFERRRPGSEWHDKYHVLDLLNIESLEIVSANGKHKTKREQKRRDHD